jgi:sirohydrochlorin cobaltochelatase
MSSTRSPAPTAPATDAAWAHAGLLLVAHGVGGAPGAAEQHAAAIRARGLFAAVAASCLKGAPSPLAAFQAMPAGRVYLVPFLMSAGYVLHDGIPAALGAALRDPRLTVCRPVGEGPHLTRIIAARAAQACVRQGLAAAETVLLLIGHGTPRDPQSRDAARAQAARLTADRQFAAVVTGFLDDAPDVGAALGSIEGRACVAVGLFADAGPHGEADARAALAPGGNAVHYAGAIGPDPAMVEIILDQVRAAV